MSRPGRWRRSLAGRLAAVAALSAAVAVALALALQHWLEDYWLSAPLALLLTLMFALWLTRRLLAPMLSLFRALTGSVASFRDGDFSFGLRWNGDDELGDLVASHNQLAQVVREQRLNLAQRELLLDTMVQNTPVAMLLLAEGGHVVYANLAARRLLNRGRKLEGLSLESVLKLNVEPLRQAFASGNDGLFSVGEDEEEQVYHLARRRFRLNLRPHELVLLRVLTGELRRQEVQTWKKVIRVISHELNNSLAPVASLAHSGAELTRRGQYERLPEIFATIEDRARHLEGFIRGYASFAKLPTPQRAPLSWKPFLAQLRQQAEFTIEGELPGGSNQVDAAQLGQALLNLFKNASESGSPPEQIRLRVTSLHEAVRIEVLDRGSGMSDAVLQNALVPFYSTKRSGTGLGLALVREIAEAHGGRVSLHNRDGGGLCVTLVLPG